MDGGCDGDPQAGFAQAEARSAGRPADFAADGGRSLSQGLDSHGRGTGSAAVADASAPSGADADAGEEPVAAHCLEPGCAEEIQVVDQGGDGATASTGAGTLDAAAARHAAGDAGRVGAEDPASGASGGARSRSPAGRATAGDASRR